MQILHIDSAVTGSDSVSRELSAAIVEHLVAAHPGASVARRDFAADPIPHLDTVSWGAVRLPPELQNNEMKDVFAKERAVFDEFMASDVVVIGAPIYNFSIPSQLKAWIDRLGIPGVAFSYSEAGPQGLAGGRRVIVASSQGGIYPDGDPAEHQESLLRAFFGLIGIDNVEIVRADKIGFGPEARADSITAARAAIARL